MNWRASGSRSRDIRRPLTDVKMRLAVGLALSAVLVVGCQTRLPAPTATPSGMLALPTIDTSEWDACAGVGIDGGARLDGDPNDVRVAWLIQSGQRRDVVFPQGLAARFTPALEIVNARGVVVARAGDEVVGGCVVGDPPNTPLLILWPPE
jgi:hypothetical protein